jgi:hypothetical protein
LPAAERAIRAVSELERCPDMAIAFADLAPAGQLAGR